MNILIYGISPHNKGATLMLEAIKTWARSRFPDAHLNVPISLPYELRAANSLYGVIHPDAGPVDLSSVTVAIPHRLRNALGIRAFSEMNVVLDASGFAYGDYWGKRVIERRLSAFSKIPGRAVVLLPQAFGPFEGPGMARAFNRAVAGVDRIFVRDRSSFEYVSSVLESDALLRVRSAPDFTNTLTPAIDENATRWAGHFFIIPNSKVVSSGSDDKHDIYLRFLEVCAELLTNAGPTAFLIHEGEADRRIVEQLNARLSRPLPVIDEPSALQTKAIIGLGRAVVSSRFHGLVSALSAGVPSLAVGWTHKYEHLMRDYDCSEYLLTLSDSARWRSQISGLIAASTDLTIRRRIGESSSKLKRETAKMWTEVERVILERLNANNLKQPLSASMA